MRNAHRRWRRLPVAVGALVAILAAVTIGKSHTPPTGLARTQVLVNTRQSELAAAAPVGADSLWWRASLLGMLLGTQQERNQIARTIGVPADEIGASNAQLANPMVPAALPVAASEAAAVSLPYVLTVYTDNVLPIVSIAASAPDRAQAVRLAQAAVQQLEAGAPTHDTPELQGLSVTEVDPIKGSDVVVSSGGHTKMVTVAVVVFGLWWAGILAIRRFKTRRSRAASAAVAAG